MVVTYETDTLPDGWHTERAAVPCIDPVHNVRDAVEAALARPLSSLPLPMLCSAGSRVTIVCADPAYDRDCPDDILVPALIAELHSAGVNDEDITLLSANGTRRPSTDLEKQLKLGRQVVERYSVVDHHARDVSEMDDLGSFDGVSVQVNYHAVEADLLIATGVVRPHLYAGYTGGGQAVAIGCSGAATVHDLHSARYLDDPSVGAGSVRDNAHQRAVREIAHRAGLQFVVNAVVNPDGQVVAVAAGAPNAVHDRLIEYAREVYEVPVSRESYHVLVAGSLHHSSRDLYRASRDVAYTIKQRDPVLARGGVVLLPVGAGGQTRRDVERQRFDEALAGADSMDDVLRLLRERGIRPGQHSAYTLAQSVVERDCRIIVVGPDRPQSAGRSGLISARDVAEAAELAEAFVGSRPHALILPRGRWLMPTYKGGAWGGDRAAAGFSESEPGWLDDIVVESVFPGRGKPAEN